MTAPSLVFDKTSLATFVQHNGALSGLPTWQDKISGASCASEEAAYLSAFASLTAVRAIDIRVDYSTRLTDVQNLFASIQ